MGGRSPACASAGAVVTYRLLWRDEASAEFDYAFDYYEAQRSGLGTEFSNEVGAAIARLLKSPLIRRPVIADIRRWAVRRFPYSIYYRLHDDLVQVVAIVHDRRDPNVWKSRIG